MLRGILNQTHVTNSHDAFGQQFWLSGKCVFVQKVLKRIIQNTPRKGPVFGHMGHTHVLEKTGGLVSNLPHPRVNKTKQHTVETKELEELYKNFRKCGLCDIVKAKSCASPASLRYVLPTRSESDWVCHKLGTGPGQVLVS